jgi:hypothetical protein
MFKPRVGEAGGQCGVLKTPWMAGPRTAIGLPVLVSVTCFEAERRRDLAGVYLAGWRLRRAWPDLPGAVGVWLWSRPLAAEAGSVSVWVSRAALRAFVALPEHMRIMHRYRRRGRVRSTTWTAPWSSPEQVWTQASRWLVQAASGAETGG